MDNDNFKIKLRPFNLIIPLTIKRDDEFLYREAERRLNYVYGRYKEQLIGYEDNELMAIAALTFAYEVMKKQDHNDTKPFAEVMEEAIEKIENRLKEART
ncbi:MAG TPA: cell division protein ZapA [Candidatus Avibacteroides excrementipullorum]|jgi:hypothetical protein|nr:cell division protein ZapA [Candidatus Avibacteroides excrementipullorum]